METSFGAVVTLSKEGIFTYLARAINELAERHPRPTVGLTGGSTPKAWYAWLAEASAPEGLGLSAQARARVIWSTSDERWVPLSDPESNFGTAARGFLDPLAIPEANRQPWPYTPSMTPAESARQMREQWRERTNTSLAFNLCLLGMGDDCHTASLFPGHPHAFKEEPAAPAFAVEVAGKGPRLTLTPAGLAASDRIVVTVTGAGKGNALKSVFSDPIDPLKRPVQMLSEMASKVIWLVDEEAASGVF